MRMAKNGKSATTQSKKGFSKNVLNSIGYYVYALIDPRNNEIFYIGKGKRNRVFDHVRNLPKQIKPYDPLKIQIIQDIQTSGKSVGYLIIRHGLTEEHALFIEATLIDLLNYGNVNFPQNGLTNILPGIQPGFGISSIDDLEVKYNTQSIRRKKREKILAININNRPQTEQDVLYRLVSGHWYIDTKRANNVDYILATNNGLVLGVFKLKGSWYHSTQIPGRHCFNGEIVTNPNVRARFFHRNMPPRLQGSQNPIRYI